MKKEKSLLLRVLLALIISIATPIIFIGTGWVIGWIVYSTGLLKEYFIDDTLILDQLGVGMLIITALAFIFTFVIVIISIADSLR